MDQLTLGKCSLKKLMESYALHTIQLEQEQLSAKAKPQPHHKQPRVRQNLQAEKLTDTKDEWIGFLVSLHNTVQQQYN
jgi:hypothetical protein